jgi:hypothetical protein
MGSVPVINIRQQRRQQDGATFRAPQQKQPATIPEIPDA